MKWTTILIILSFQIGLSQNQDINLSGNGNNIFNGGSNSPSLTNNTDFGDNVIQSSFEMIFSIENTFSGGNPRNNKLTVNEINISGANANDFVISGISLPKSINRNNSTTFKITFTPTTIGIKTAIVSITSDDPDENPYTFNLQGYGTEIGNEPSLTLINTYPLSVLEPSGLAFDKTNNVLFTVSDNTNLIYKISTTGVIQQILNYSGNDLEGVSIYTTNKLLIAEEGNRKLVEYDYVIDDGTSIAHTMNTNTPIDGGAENDGIEGVTYDSVNNKIYFLIEKNNGGLCITNSSFGIENDYEDPLSHGGDYSGAYFVEETGFLWLASDQTSTIYKCNTDGTMVNSFPVKTAGGGTIDKLEGIAIDHANQLLYAVSDAGQELYIFSINNDDGNNSTEITAVEDFFPVLDGVNGETTSMSVLDNDTFDNMPATLTEVSLLAVNPISNIILNPDGTITVLPNTDTVEYYLTYEICELTDPFNCSLATNMILVVGQTPTTTDVIISGDYWNYYSNENEPSGSWKTLGYDDSSWNSGNAVLGFNNGETTTINSASTTAYFRKTIQITDSNLITSVDLSAIRDDGMIVYVNAVEVWRDNMPTGSVSYNTEASSYIKDANETIWINQNISNNLVDGDNIVAVEVHIKKPKGRNKTPDMSFDFEITITSGASSRLAGPIKTNSKEKEVTLYPNPAFKTLNISLKDENDEILGVYIYNSFGKLAKTSSKKKIDVSNLLSGIYNVVLRTSKSTYSKIIIIKQ